MAVSGRGGSRSAGGSTSKRLRQNKLTDFFEFSEPSPTFGKTFANFASLRLCENPGNVMQVSRKGAKTQSSQRFLLGLSNYKTLFSESHDEKKNRRALANRAAMRRRRRAGQRFLADE